MIELRWSEEAVADLERIADYLFERTPEHAQRIVRAIYDAPAKLVDFPEIGRPGRAAGTREFILSALPYLVVYIHDRDAIHIARILHGAQRWP